MSYYRTCPHCGANLDPGEVCDCHAALEAEAMRLVSRLTPEQLAQAMKEAALDATNIQDGKQTPHDH